METQHTTRMVSCAGEIARERCPTATGVTGAPGSDAGGGPLSGVSSVMPAMSYLVQDSPETASILCPLVSGRDGGSFTGAVAALATGVAAPGATAAARVGVAAVAVAAGGAAASHTSNDPLSADR